MPTHRYCGKVKQNMHELLDLDAIEELCKKNNYVFIIKKHFYHKSEVEDFSKYNFIYDITSENIDSEVLIYQADIMISDYSSSYLDYLLLDRPIILYAYDIQDYLKNERGMYVKFNDINVGYKPENKEDLIVDLKKLIQDDRDAEHIDGRNKMKNLQFDKDVAIGNARENICEIIDQLMSNKYVSKWK